MSRAKIFILAWGLLLVTVAILFYVYLNVFGIHKIGKINIFAKEPTESANTDDASNGWFGKLSSSADLYPANEADFHLDLGEHEKTFVITIGNLNKDSLSRLESKLKDNLIEYRVVTTDKAYTVEIDSSNKDKMQAKLEVIKNLNLSPKN